MEKTSAVHFLRKNFALGVDDTRLSTLLQLIHRCLILFVTGSHKCTSGNCMLDLKVCAGLVQEFGTKLDNFVEHPGLGIKMEKNVPPLDCDILHTIVTMMLITIVELNEGPVNNGERYTMDLLKTSARILRLSSFMNTVSTSPKAILH